MTIIVALVAKKLGREKSPRFVKYSENEDISYGVVKLRRGWLRPKKFTYDNEDGLVNKAVHNMELNTNDGDIPSRSIYKT